MSKNKENKINQTYKERVKSVVETAIEPAYKFLPERMNSYKATVLLCAIGLQESRLIHRYQIVSGVPGAKGPARGLWQFELGSPRTRAGVHGVFLHHASRPHLQEVCRKMNIPFEPREIWNRLETNDVLAAAVARLLMFTDPRALPDVKDFEATWDFYAKRLWRPGKPHRHTWDNFMVQSIRGLA